jgi:predicted enzyme related to lactoylglutathione lyase
LSCLLFIIAARLNGKVGPGGAETICDARRNKPENKLLYCERSNAASGELRNTISKLEMAMNQVQVEQKSYQMPPQDGFTVAHFLTVADVERSLRFYETVFGGRILSRGDSSGAPGYIQIANTWLLVNPGGGPTPDKPSVTLSVPANPDSVSSFMNIRVADIQACYELWRSRGAEFITEPKPKYGETRCYIRDPDGYIIEVGQSNPGVAYG